MKKHIVFFDVTKDDKTEIKHFFSSHSDIELTFIKEGLDDETIAEARNAQVISVHVSSKVTAEYIRAMPQLKMISARSTGFDNIDLDEAKKRDIVVCNVPGYGANTVAEYAFMLMLALSRRLLPSLRQIEDGRIDHPDLTGFDLKGKTLGVIGTGNIGRHVIRIGRGFEMNVIAFDPFENHDAALEIGFSYVPLDELIAQANIISLHAPYTKENHHLINRRAFNAMKPEAILINTARGELVDTKALVEALNAGTLGGAGLDVIEGENLLETDEEISMLSSPTIVRQLPYAIEQLILEKMPNVILTPHNAFNAKEALARIRLTSINNINAFLSGQSQNQVNKK